MLLANFATLATALFTGAAVYISHLGHPARLRCPTDHAVEQWRPSYHRARAMQASLAVAGWLLAIAAWLSGAGLVWLPAGLVLGAVVPFALIVMWPTNKQLEDPGLYTTGKLARSLLVRWGRFARCPFRAQPACLDRDAVCRVIASASKALQRKSARRNRPLARSVRSVDRLSRDRPGRRSKTEYIK
jgi:hypothetical protein